MNCRLLTRTMKKITRQIAKHDADPDDCRMHTSRGNYIPTGKEKKI